MPFARRCTGSPASSSTWRVGWLRRQAPRLVTRVTGTRDRMQRLAESGSTPAKDPRTVVIMARRQAVFSTRVAEYVDGLLACRRAQRTHLARYAQEDRRFRALFELAVTLDEIEFVPPPGFFKNLMLRLASPRTSRGRNEVGWRLIRPLRRRAGGASKTLAVR